MSAFHLPAIDFQAAKRLQQELSVSFTTAQVLLARGFGEPEDAHRWLFGSQEFKAKQFDNISSVVDRILHHLASESLITIHGDYDVDGVTATTILVSRLRALGGNVDWFIPSRHTDGYGLTEATVETLRQRGTQLIVTVDCGITSVEAAQRAKTCGVELLITDHHTPRSDGKLPDAVLLHPQLSGYPNVDLCAAGVAYRLVQAIYEASDQSGEELVADLDLVALATVADCVALTGENRFFVQAGLQQLKRTQRLGMRALLRSANVDALRVDAQDIAYRLAPRINAAGRLYRADAGVELFLTTDETRATQIAAELQQMNVERREVEQRIYNEAKKQVTELGERAGYVLAGEGWHVGVVGIVAAKIAQEYQRPAVLIAFDGDTGVGSGRSVAGFHLLGAFDACSDFLSRYGGHHAAAGCEVQRAQLEGFQQAFHEYAETFSGELNQAMHVVDAVVPAGEVGLPLAQELEKLGPFGVGNEAPRLLFPTVQFRDLKPIGNGQHLRFTVQVDDKLAQAVAFRSGPKLPVPEQEFADAEFALEVNHWQGKTEAQLRFERAFRCDIHELPLLAPDIAVFADVRSWIQQRLESSSLTTEASKGTLARDLERFASQSQDFRGVGAFGVLRALAASEETLLVMTADTYLRSQLFSCVEGNLHITDYRVLLTQPERFTMDAHIAVFDPPCQSNQWQQLFRISRHDCVSLLWGERELSYQRSMVFSEETFRLKLTGFYRQLQSQGKAGQPMVWSDLLSCSELQLRSMGTIDLLAVLVDLGLVILDSDEETISLVVDKHSPLESSAFYQSLMSQNDATRNYLS